jgi:geranylgeranyl diphosphate synthase type II
MNDKIIQHSKTIEENVQQYDFPITPNNLYDPLRYFITLGGKRIRPVLTLLGAELFSVKAEKAIHAAIAVELFHNFTLIHDDIMDVAPLRRAKPTVHTKWNENIAILSGDVLMVKSYQELCKQQASEIPELMSVFNKTAIEVCEGQQLDMDFESRADVSIEEYIEMIRLKTSVLLGCALEMGAIIAKASPTDRSHLYTFGQELGVAFQIKDDILDLYGNPEKFGKQIGGDVISNKKTLLYLTALKDANSSQKEQFLALENEKDLTVKIESVKSLFDTLNIRQKAEESMEFHRMKAMKAMEAISVDEDKKSDLNDLARYLMEREN